MARMTDEQLLGAINAAEAAAIGALKGEVSSDRADATDRYLGKPYGNEQEGRSSVVSRDVADVVDGVLANVIKPFVAGDQMVQFVPRGPEDEAAAQQESDYCNLIALERNNGFHVLSCAIKDALLLRNGYVKAGWRVRSDVTLERYEGLSDDEMAILAADQAVEIVEHSEYPDLTAAVQPMPAAPAMGMGMVPSMPPVTLLHDVRVRRKLPTEYAEISAVPPDEMLVSERATSPSLQDVDFVQHRTHKSLSEIRQMGYDVDDDVSDDDDGESIEEDARDRYSSGDKWDNETNDPSRRTVVFKETYLRIDRDGDGIAELRRVCSIGMTLLADEEADVVPFACFAATLMPHQHLGISVYDQIKELALLKTAMLRQFVDNKYLANNQRMIVDPSRVNIDDLLVSRPGGIIRSVDPSSVIPLVSQDTGASALQALEYFDSMRENRTGYTRTAQGMGADSLMNKTATALLQASSQSQMRLEMIARTIAETGVRDLFNIIHALTLKHSTRGEKLQLRGKWVEVDPREWVKRSDLQISVGLGTANSDQTLAKLNALAPLMQQAQAAGLAGPMEFYAFGAEILKAAGYKNPDKFIKPPPIDPQTGQPKMPPPKPDPAILAAQEQGKAVVAAEQVKAQSAEKRAMIDAEVSKYKIDKDATTEIQKQYLINSAKLLIESQQGALEEQRLALDAQRQRMEQQMNGLESVIQKLATGVDFAPILEALQVVERRMRAPRKIVRGADGRAIGVRVDDGDDKPTVQ